jgi:hypothetical protein
MIPRVRIDRAKEFKTCHEVHQSFNLRNRRTIFRASLIQIYEIYTHSLIIMVFFIITMFVNQSGYITSRIKSAMSIFFHLFSYWLLSFASNFFSNERGKVRFTFSWCMATLGTPSMSEYLKAKLIFWMLSSSVKPRSCLGSNIDPSLWWPSHLNETVLFWFLRF